MNFSAMLNGYAFGTIKPRILDPRKSKDDANELDEMAEQARLETLNRGRATRTALAQKRLAEIPARIKLGEKRDQIAAHFGVSCNTILKDIKACVAAGTVTKAEAIATFPANGMNADRYETKMQKRSLELRKKIIDAVARKPLNVYELAERLSMHRVSVMWQVKRLILEEVLEKIDGRPYKIGKVKKNKAGTSAA